MGVSEAGMSMMGDQPAWLRQLDRTIAPDQLMAAASQMIPQRGIPERKDARE